MTSGLSRRPTAYGDAGFARFLRAGLPQGQE
jgi:hypothetical protein